MELVLVLLVAVVLSGLAVPSLSGLGRAKANITATQVRSLFVFSQAWAIGTGRPTWVGYDPSSKEIRAFEARMDHLSFPMRVALLDPLSRAPLIVDLNDLFGEKDPIMDRYAEGKITFKFDPMGVPVDSDDKPLDSDVLIPLADGIGVRIRAGTGLVGVL